MSNALVTQESNNAAIYRASTDAANLCRDIVMATAKNIQGRRYVCVEGWMAIAVAHGCAAGARDVERIEGGVRAIGEVKRMSDGMSIAVGEGFVGEDETTWFGGETLSYGKVKVLPKRADYAIRAMAQTRAISRACRSAFAHVVVMIDAGLSTTPAEEVPMGGFDDGNVIDSAPQPDPTPKRKPEPLKGPIKQRAQVRIACGQFVRELHSITDSGGLSGFLDANKALMNQVEEECEFFWLGDGADFAGMKAEIDLAKDRIAVAELN